MQGGLRELYRTLELPGSNPLRAAHEALNTAVMSAYGFNPSHDILTQILGLNGAIYANPQARGPGMPLDLVSRSELISADCVEPNET
jgi:hypothetical protein